MGLFKEFKDFAVKGNVVDLAVGVIIGAAFGKIVTSFVNDIVMPPIGLAMGGVDFADLKYILKESVVDAAGAVTTEAVAINYGNFINIIIQFLIIGFCVFMVVKGFNSMKKKEAAAAPPAPAAPPADVVLLSEIRDLLKK